MGQPGAASSGALHQACQPWLQAEDTDVVLSRQKSNTLRCGRLFGALQPDGGLDQACGNGGRTFCFHLEMKLKDFQTK